MEAMVDPVLEWLKSHPGAAPPLEHHARFELDKGSLAIHSNRADIVAEAQEQFHHYAPTNNHPCESPGLTIDVHHAYFAKGEEGIVLDPYWQRLADGRRRNDGLECPVFQHLTAGGLECFWRASDALLSYATTPQPHIRILIGEPCTHEDFESHDAESIVDLIKILYVRSHGLFCIHAAALALNEYGVVITGSSGAGKSTTALALLRGGFDLLSDELTLIDTSQDGVLRISGLLVPPRIVDQFQTPLDNLEGTLRTADPLEKNAAMDDPPNGTLRIGVRLAPPQRARERRPPLDSAVQASDPSLKRLLTLDPSFVQTSRRRAVRPKTIIALDPRKHDGPEHRLVPFEAQHMFVALMTQVLDVTGLSRREAQADALIGLLNECRLYRLVLGRDLAALPALIASCMEAGNS